MRSCSERVVSGSNLSESGSVKLVPVLNGESNVRVYDRLPSICGSAAERAAVTWASARSTWECASRTSSLWPTARAIASASSRRTVSRDAVTAVRSARRVVGGCAWASASAGPNAVKITASERIIIVLLRPYVVGMAIPCVMI